jgi:hypothetical protein
MRVFLRNGCDRSDGRAEVKATRIGDSPVEG